MVDTATSPTGLLSPVHIRALAEELDLRPTKQWGQNFVVDPNTVRRIVRLADLRPTDAVVEVGPGLGSLTLALLPEVAHVTAIEVDPELAGLLERTVAHHYPAGLDKLTVTCADALTVTKVRGSAPTALVSNLPYNISVPVVLSFLQHVSSIRRLLVMVQLEVAERMVAAPGSKTYGAPSAKVAWYGSAELVGKVPRTVFWPVPNVDSGLVRITRRPEHRRGPARDEVFRVIDAAFGQRRKTLRSALAGWAGSPDAAEQILRGAGIDAKKRGEQLGIEEFAAIAAHRVKP